MGVILHTPTQISPIYRGLHVLKLRTPTPSRMPLYTGVFLHTPMQNSSQIYRSSFAYPYAKNRFLHPLSSSLYAYIVCMVMQYNGPTIPIYPQILLFVSVELRLFLPSSELLQIYFKCTIISFKSRSGVGSLNESLTLL